MDVARVVKCAVDMRPGSLDNVRRDPEGGYVLDDRARRAIADVVRSFDEFKRSILILAARNDDVEMERALAALRLGGGGSTPRIDVASAALLMFLANQNTAQTSSPN